MNIVLLAPEIPGNTGSLGRTAVALNGRLILIEPLGFDLSEKAVRRAGLDYWKYVNLTVYPSFEEFLAKEEALDDDLFFFENHQEQTVFDAKFSKNSYLIFGGETQGIPASLLERYPNKIYSLPMFSDQIRSLNLSNAATAVCYECLRQTQ